MGLRVIMHRKAFTAVFVTFGIALTVVSGPAFGGRSLHLEVVEPSTVGAHYTCTYDIPWDWVHRCPSFARDNELSSETIVVPHLRSCTSENVTVSRGDGKDQTVTITRC